MSKSGQVFDSMDLISASSVGEYNLVDHILKNELEDVNKVNSSGWTALMYAANYGHYNIIRLLVKYNCNVDQRDWQGRTALMMAATNGHTRSIDALINSGKADKSLKDRSGTNAYQYAKNCGHGNNKLIKELLLNSAKGHELRGRSISKSKTDSSTKVMTPNKSSFENTKALNASQDIYNPYKMTAFSGWKPITSDTFSEFRGPTGSQESLASNLSSSPPDSVHSEPLSLSQSSQSSAISLPPNYKPKAIKSRNNSPVIQISGPMQKTLFHLLTRIDLIQYLDLFENNGIDFYQFLTLTDDDFQNLGIANYGHRKKLSIAQMRYHESLDINCTQESFLADYLLNQRASLNRRIQDLELKIKKLCQSEDI